MTIKWSKRKLKALRASIRKWEQIVKREIGDEGCDNCPLCHLYFDNGCSHCPIRETTNQDGCLGTPYEEWCDAHRAWATSFPYIANSIEERKIAQRELDFLRSLLPKGKEVD